MARELISKNATKSVYRDGDKAIKSFCVGFPKAEVLNEAVVSARIEEIGGINIPATQAVSVDEDGCWSITKDFIDGKTLKQLMDENPDKLDEYMEQMVDLQLTIHSKVCPLLNKLKDKMIRQISDAEGLNSVNRYDLLTRLDGMPKHVKLCHGDFQPNNIIVKDDGTMYVLDWVHATQGNASADAARTYLLLCLEDQNRADKYMDLFCEKSFFTSGWTFAIINRPIFLSEKTLPIAAGSFLVYTVPRECLLLIFRQCHTACRHQCLDRIISGETAQNKFSPQGT